MERGTPQKDFSKNMALLRANMHVLDNQRLFVSLDKWWSNMKIALNHRGYDMLKLQTTETDVYIYDLYLRHLEFTCTPHMQSFFNTLEENIMKRVDDSWNRLMGYGDPSPCCSSSVGKSDYSSSENRTNRNTFTGASVISTDFHRLKSFNNNQAQQMADQSLRFDENSMKDPLDCIETVNISSNTPRHFSLSNENMTVPPTMPIRKRKTNLIQEEQRLPYQNIDCEEVEAYPYPEIWKAPVIHQVTGNYNESLFSLDETYRSNRHFNQAQQFSPSGSSIIELLQNTVTKACQSRNPKPRKVAKKPQKKPINQGPVQKRTRQRKKLFLE